MSYGRARGLMCSMIVGLINKSEKYDVKKYSTDGIYETNLGRGREIFSTIEFNDKRWRHGNFVILEKIKYSDIVSLVHYALDNLEYNKPNFNIKKVEIYLECRKRSFKYEIKPMVRYNGDGELHLHKYQRDIIDSYTRYRDISHIEGGHLDIGIDEDKFRESIKMCGLEGCNLDLKLEWKKDGGDNG